MPSAVTSLKKATLINSIAKYYNVLCAFVINIILSRILTPQEYGVVAVVTVFITFFSLFSDLGFGIAYIQNKTLTQIDRDYLFTFLVYIGLLLFIVFYLFSYIIAWFYNDEIYIRVSQLLGVNLFLTAVNVIPYSDLLKQQRFKTVAIVQVFASTVSSVSAVLFALRGLSYYSIIFQSILNLLLLGFIYIAITGTKFRLKPKRDVLHKVASFSLGQLGFNSINYFSRNLDNLLIGKVFGNTALGYYDKAYKTTTYPVSNLSSIIGSSIQPVLSKYQDDVDLVYDKFKKSFLFLVVIGAFLSISLSLSARETILVLYGSQWENSITAFSILALSLFAQMSLNITGAFYQVLNDTKLLALAGGASALLIVSGIVMGLLIGSIEAVATGYLVAQSFNFIVILLIMRLKLFRRRIDDIIKVLIRILTISLITYFVARYLFMYLPIEQMLLRLFMKMLIVGLIYSLLAFAFHVEKYVLGVVFSNYNRR